MNKSTRRDFLKTGLAGAAGFAAGPRPLLYSAEPTINVVSVSGPDPFANARIALAELPGVSRLFSGVKSVGLVINAPSWWRNPGSFTRPEVTLAMILLCREVGVHKIQYLIDPASDYWNRTPLKTKYAKDIAAVERCSGDYVEKTVPQGTALRTGRFIRELFECDRVINLPIIKHHTGVKISCSLKNMMGACADRTNRYFHNGSGASGSYDDIDFLSQCVADLNLLRKPDLCLLDASEFVTANGPAGPGPLQRAQQVLAGLDPVAVDAQAAKLLGHGPADVRMITLAAKSGVGRSTGYTHKAVKA